MFNSQSGFISIGNKMVASIVITEKVNSYNGDIDSKITCEFSSQSCQSIGTYTVLVRGQYVKPIRRETTGNGEALWQKYGNVLLREYDLIN